MLSTDTYDVVDSCMALPYTCMQFSVLLLLVLCICMFCRNFKGNQTLSLRMSIAKRVKNSIENAVQVYFCLRLSFSTLIFLEQFSYDHILSDRTSGHDIACFPL